MKLGVLMDAWSSLKPYKDSTCAMIQSALQMGWDCYTFTPKEMFCRQNDAFALASKVVHLDAASSPWVEFQPAAIKPLQELDILLMRKDPPFDMEYIYATYALELAAKKGVLVANNPQGLRDANEKFFTLLFPHCCPKTLVSKNHAHLREFFEQHQNVIFKPLAGMGGSSVFHVDEKGQNLSVVLEVLTQQETVTIMAQEYIPDIAVTGDKRILIINGEPIAYALARIPAKGDIRGNLAKGAEGKVVPLTARDRFLCKEIAPVLQEKGLYFVGIDVIGEYITEINVTSPTCIKEIEAETGLDIAGKYLCTLETIILSR